MLSAHARRTLFLLCLLLVFPQAQAPASGANSATVAGRVVLRGEPARGVEVALYPPQIIANVVTGGQRTKTDAEGRFAFAGVAAGTHTLRAVAPGFIAPADSPYQPGKQLTVASGGQIDDLVIELKPGGVITGRVKDERGRPLVGQQIQLKTLDAEGKPQFYYGGQQYWEMVFTDDRGVYRIYGLPAGRYLVFVGREVKEGQLHLHQGGSYRSAVYYPNAFEEAQAKPVLVQEGAVVEEIDLTLGEAKRTYRVVGRVSEQESGQPLAGIAITVASLYADDERYGSFSNDGEVKTNAQGEFVVIGVLPGRYHLWAGSRGESSEWMGEAVVCEVKDGDVEDVLLKATRGASLSGTLVFEAGLPASAQAALDKWEVSATRASDGNRRTVFRTAKVDGKGGFALLGVAEGRITFRVMPPSATPELRGVTLLRVERDGASLPDDAIQVARGERITGLRLVLSLGSGAIRGQVQVVGGVLPEGLIVYLVADRTDDTRKEGRTTQVDARGRFLLGQLLPGTYRLGLSVYSLTPNFTDAEMRRWQARAKQATTEVTVGSGMEATATLTLDLSRKEGEQ